jgi:hypothetical protein
MNAWKCIAIGQIVEYLLRRTDEAPTVGYIGVLGHRPAFVEDQNRKRLMLLAQDLDESGSWLREWEAVHCDLHCQSGKRREQSLDRIAVRADEKAPRPFGIFKSWLQQEKVVSTHVRSPGST